MNCEERLTIRYDGLPAPKELCTINKNGEVKNCDLCEKICKQLKKCDECPIQKCFNKLSELEDKLENGTLIELPYKIGTDVYVSPNDGKNFYIGTLYGVNEKGSYLVFIHHKVCDICSIPLEKDSFYDWHFKIYSKEEVEAMLKELQNEVK